MTLTKFALGSAAAVVLTGLLSAAPAAAFTFHPATPQEIKQTDDLNAQALAAARSGTTPAGFNANAAGTVDNGTVNGSSDTSTSGDATAKPDATNPGTGISDTTSTKTQATPQTGASPSSKNTPTDGQ
jgi:hypothetical protein